MNIPKQTKTAGVVLVVGLALVGVQPTSAVSATLDGPGEVSKTDTVGFAASVGVEAADARLDSLVLTFRSVDGDGSVTVTLTPDGAVRRVDPPRGTVGRGEIRVGLLRRTLTVTPVDDSDGGYGYGYGYGYAADDPTYDVRVDARAFRRGTYEVTLTAVCEGGRSASDTARFEVTLPAGAVGPGGADDASAAGEGG